MRTVTPGCTPPFTFAHQLTLELHGPSRSVPGHPRISLDNKGQVWNLLAKELCSNDMDHVAGKLWWMSKQDGSSISPLHRQRVKGRSIVITEDPKLHLVWIYNRIFIKPLPRYLASYTFWRDYLCTDGSDAKSSARIRRAALGFLRTYYYLVKNESDFRIAQDPALCLIPAYVTWEQFCEFTAGFSGTIDWDVSLRYAHGEIRLTRLNFYAPFLLGRSHFQKVDYQYGTYFARFYAPILFVIGVVSVILSGLQVIVSVDAEEVNTWRMGAPLWISVVMILMACGVLFSLGFMVVYKVVKEWRVAIRDHMRLLEEKREI